MVIFSTDAKFELPTSLEEAVSEHDSLMSPAVASGGELDPSHRKHLALWRSVNGGAKQSLSKQILPGPLPTYDVLQAKTSIVQAASDFRLSS